MISKNWTAFRRGQKARVHTPWYEYLEAGSQQSQMVAKRELTIRRKGMTSRMLGESLEDNPYVKQNYHDLWKDGWITQNLEECECVQKIKYLSAEGAKAAVTQIGWDVNEYEVYLCESKVCFHLRRILFADAEDEEDYRRLNEAR